MHKQKCWKTWRELTCTYGECGQAYRSRACCSPRQRSRADDTDRAMLPAETEGQLSKLQHLHAEAADRLQRAHAPRSRTSLRTVLKHFARFAAECPERTLFRRPRALGDMEASAWNEWTLILFAVYLRTRISDTTGRPVAVRTVSTYVSLAKGHFSFNYEFELTERTPRLKRLLTSMEDEDPMSGVRKKRRGLRRRHLLKIWKHIPEARATTPAAVNEHALLVVAWHILARGGELAPTVKQWVSGCGPSRADVQFDTMRDGRRYAVVWVRPLKKKKASERQPIPQYITEHDGGGADAYTALQRLVRYDPVTDAAAAHTPLFRKHKHDGLCRHMTVKDMRELVRSRMRKLGYPDAKQWAAHSCRIGGATDLVSTGKASPILLQAKGRWGSDIGRIYARMTRRSQLAGSALMYKGKGRDLEELLPAFVQPAA